MCTDESISSEIIWKFSQIIEKIFDFDENRPIRWYTCSVKQVCFAWHAMS